MLISGTWNQRDPNGKIIEHTRRSARRLGDDCLACAGLTVRDVGLQDDCYPAVDWDRVPALRGLKYIADLCHVRLPADLMPGAIAAEQPRVRPAVTREEMRTAAAVYETEIADLRKRIGSQEQTLARNRSALAAAETALRVLGMMS